VGVLPSGRPARVMLADDHDLMREGLRAVLKVEEDLEVVGEAKNGLEAIELCRRLRPDLVLMDVRMPRADGLEATRAIKAEMPQVSVVVVTMHENPDYLLEAVRAGAAGYILKDASGKRLVEAVRKTLSGESPLSQDLAMRLLRRLADEEAHSPSQPEPDQRRGPAPKGITPREVDVLRLIAQGRTNHQIANKLGISRGTAKIHVQSIIAKLGVSDRTQAAVRAIELGVLDPKSSGLPDGMATG
jgi:two-component system, NarL family, response regulator LiaR